MSLQTVVCMYLNEGPCQSKLSHTGHIVQHVRAPVSSYDGGEDVIKGVKIFGGNQAISEQPAGLVCYNLQHAVCHIRLSYKGIKGTEISVLIHNRVSQY